MDHGMIVLTSHFQGEEQVGKVRKDMAEMLPHHPTTPVRGWVVRNACSARPGGAFQVEQIGGVK